MDSRTDLGRIAALLSAEDRARYLVTSYRNENGVLAEVMTVEASTPEAALAIGETAFLDNPVIFVIREVTDAMGIIRSAVIRTFGQSQP